LIPEPTLGQQELLSWLSPADDIIWQAAGMIPVIDAYDKLLPEK